MSDIEVIKVWDVTQRVCLNTLGNIIPHRLMQKTSKSSKVLWHEPTQTMLVGTYTE